MPPILPGSKSLFHAIKVFLLSFNRGCSIIQIYDWADFTGFDVVKNDVMSQDDIMF